MSVNATNPSSLFGGTWEQIRGRFLVGTGLNDANTSNFWGSEFANHYNIPAGELGGESWHTLTVDQMPSHAHTVNIWNPTGVKGGAQWASEETYGATLTTAPYGATAPSAFTWNNSTPMVSGNGKGDEAGVTKFSGGGKEHNNMPPYLAVYMWKRTA